MRILITGAAGFIGFHLAQRFITDGHEVAGIDNLNDYYSPQLKKDRLAILKALPAFSFYESDLADDNAINKIFAAYKPSHVVNLAAQAGVRYSLINPKSYIQANMVGFANILEACRHNKVEHLVFASSSSVYGLNSKMPFSTKDPVNHPVSLYAASKKSNELMAHSYSHLYNIPCTGLRFFTVYGPWGRPDMALFSFTKNIIEGKAIDLFNNGKMQRDFTYIDDIVNGVAECTYKTATVNSAWNSAIPDPASSSAPYRIYNIGNNSPVELETFVATIEKAIGIKAKINLMPMQPGDVFATFANIDEFEQLTGFKPSTSLEYGIVKFVEWYKNYYEI